MPTFGNNYYLIQSKMRGGAVPGAGGGGGWTPASLGSTLKLWLDGSSTTYTGGTNNGDAITAWSDRSSNGNNTTGTGTLRTAQQNGLNAVEFNGTSNRFTLTSAIDFSTGGYTIWCVVKRVTNAEILGRTTAPTTAGTLEWFGDASFYVYDDGAYSYKSGANTYTDTTSYHTIVATRDTSGTAAGANVYYDSDAVLTCDTRSGSGLSWVHNAVGYGDNNYAGMYLGEMGACDTVLSSGDITSLRAYLKTKWGTA